MRSKDKILPFPTMFKGYAVNINCNQSKQLQTIIRREQCLFPASTMDHIEASLLLVQLLNQSSGCNKFWAVISLPHPHPALGFVIYVFLVWVFSSVWLVGFCLVWVCFDLCYYCTDDSLMGECVCVCVHSDPKLMYSNHFLF